MTEWFLTILGAALIFIVLRDIFFQLIRPGGKGNINELIVRGMWRGFQKISKVRPAALSLAGPFAFISVVLAWALLLAVGWALIYWPRLPQSFLLSSGLDPSEHDGFFDALYISLVGLTTLGYGDIAPKITDLRLLAACEALVGFALLSAGITWLLSMYPAISRQRTLAHAIWLLREEQNESHAHQEDSHSSTAAQFLCTLTSQVAAVRSDLKQFPIVFYFHTTDRKDALAAALPFLVDLAERGKRATSPDYRFAAGLLSKSIDDLAITLAHDFLSANPSSTTKDILGLFAKDHRHERDRVN